MVLPDLPLVLTKLRVPVMRDCQIPRARLVTLLDADADASLVLVCAPAGYGKTSLLVEWASSQSRNGTSVIWYSLDPGDDDPTAFCTYLVASFIQALGASPELAQLAQLLQTAPEMDPQYTLNAVANVVLSREGQCLLVLDDYHLISAPAIHNALVHLLEHLPANLKIAIGSRSDPPLSLARLRGRARLLEIRSANLRFDDGETGEFLNGLMQLDLSLAELATLEERTEGWVTGLQLAALSLSGRGGAEKEKVIASFTGSHRYLVEYLMEEVVDRQPEDVRNFLLSTSILERLCASLCDRVLEGSEPEKPHQAAGIALGRPPANSQTILEKLEKSNLFLVSLDEERVWFRYHHLFRDFLRARLARRQPEQIPAMHRSACEWLAEHSFLREAARHAFQSDDWEYAANFAEQHNFFLITHSDITTITEWCSAFPEEVMAAHPTLCLQQALALAYRCQRKNRPRVEARLLQVDRTLSGLKDSHLIGLLEDLAEVVRTFLVFTPDPQTTPGTLQALARGMPDPSAEGSAGQFSHLLLAGYADLALQDVAAAGESFEKARLAGLREHLYFGVVEANFYLAQLAQNQGMLHKATDICESAKADLSTVLTHPERELPALGSLDILLGSILLEQGCIEEADLRLHHGLEVMGGGMNPHYLTTAYVALHRLYLLQNKPAEAVKALDHLKAAWSDISFLTEGLRIRQLLRTDPGDPHTLEVAEDWCRNLFVSSIEGTPLPGMGPYGAAEAYYQARLAWIEIQITAGKTDRARACLEPLLDQASARHLFQRVIELSLLEALARHCEGDYDRSLAALGWALELAQPEGYLCVFDRGPVVTRMLVQAARRGLSPEYIRRILAAMSGHGLQSSRNPAQALYGEILSERELEVLRLLGQGATNQEIADHLVITVGTVKSHVNHILAKLDARNRLEAVTRARGLGLIQI